MGCKVTWYLMEHLVEHISNMVSRWHFGAAWTRSAQSRTWSVKVKNIKYSKISLKDPTYTPD